MRNRDREGEGLTQMEPSPPSGAGAYNLGNSLRTLAGPEPAKDWSLTTLKDKLFKGREVREPRPLCRLPDRGGRHPC